MSTQKHFLKLSTLLLATCGMLTSGVSRAQQPRINTLFPIGGRAGETVEVEIRGSSLAGAEKIVVQGTGISGTVDPGGVKVDETFKVVWQNKCASCHELRSPSNRSMTPAQWAATVDRMVKVRQAPLSADEQNKVTQYLTGLARAGKVTAQLKIAPDALPGLYEMRVTTPKGISTVGLFEVGRLPEILAVSNKQDQPLSVTLPCVANGSIVGNSERHYFKFAAQKAQRYVFNMKAYRYNVLTQEFFNPQLRLYDPMGKQITENHGYYDLDPLIDWTCPTDGEYVLEVRDLLGRGNPGDVYRLAMGSVPYDTALYPPVATTNAHLAANVIGKNLEGVKTGFNLDAPKQTGISMVGSPVGPLPLYVTAYPVVRAEVKSASSTTLPATFTGRFAPSGEAQTFSLQGNGRFEFNVYATRLGSPSRVRATLLNAKGGAVANMGGIGRNDGLRQLDMDGRMAANLQAGQVYTLRVEAPKERQVEPEDDSTGTAYVYCVEAHPAAAVLEAVARPASVTIRPGMATAVEVILARREGIAGDVTVTAQDLPPGVTATTAAIQPDRNRAFLILTADASAKPIDQPIHIMASAKGTEGEITTRAVPQELYQINNDRRWRNRADCLAVVRGQPEFTATLADSGPIRVRPKKAVEVKVKIQRREGFKGGVLIQIDGLPSGWVANQVGAGPDQNEITMIVRPDGNNRQPFLQRDAKWTPIRAIVTASVEEYEFVVGTPIVIKADNADAEEKSDQDR